MQSYTCQSCLQHARSHFRRHLSTLQIARRGLSSHRNRNELPESTLRAESWYWDTNAPSALQLAAASHFFKTFLPRKLWTASEWRAQNDDDGALKVPEVVFLGRSNVGKSSLLNGIFNAPDLNRVGPKPGKTKVMHAWGVSATDPTTGGALKGMGNQMDNKLAILDAPGYGHASQAGWGDDIIKYLSRRKQLRRVFVLLNPEHGIKQTDQKLLEMLRSGNISHQVIATKCDKLTPQSQQQALLQAAMEKMKDAIQPPGAERDGGVIGLGEILAVSSAHEGQSTAVGIANVRWAVLVAVGLHRFAEDVYTKFQASQHKGPVWHGFAKRIRPSDWLFGDDKDPRNPKGPGTSSTLLADLKQRNKPNPRSVDEEWEAADWLFEMGKEETKTLPLTPAAPINTTQAKSSQPAPPHPKPPNPPANPNIGRGMEAFLSMTGSADKGRTDKSQAQPNVGRGMEAFLSMTGSVDKGQAQPKRRRRKQPTPAKSPTPSRGTTPSHSQPRVQQKPPPPSGPSVRRGMNDFLAFAGVSETRGNPANSRTKARRGAGSF